MYPNPVNDFYMRNAAMYQQPPYQQQFNFPPVQPKVPAIHATWVTGIEEAKASRSDDFLATNLFVDTSTGKIYMKRIDNDGRPQFLTYVIEETIQQDPLTEIKSHLINIESALGGLNVKSIPSNENVQQSARVSDSAITGQNEPNDEIQSTGFSKNAGNDKWQKRK